MKQYPLVYKKEKVGYMEQHPFKYGLISIWYGLIIYKYPICCVTQFVYEIFKQQPPSYKRHKEYNFNEDEREYDYVPCNKCLKGKKVMICYKWVIKEEDFYKPIVNNGGMHGAKNAKLKSYKRGKTINNFIDIHKLCNINQGKRSRFNIPGFHFWKNPTRQKFEQYERCMKQVSNTKINCTLKCFIRTKDIILGNDEQIIAKQFRILGEVNETSKIL